MVEVHTQYAEYVSCGLLFLFKYGFDLQVSIDKGNEPHLHSALSPQERG